MNIEQIRAIVGRCRDLTTAEIIYKDKGGNLITKTAYLNPFDRALQLSGFEEIPTEYRESYRKDYPELPCLTIALSLDRNNTAYDQPKLNVLPRDVSSIELLTPHLNAEDENELSNSIQIRTKNDHMNLQTVAGYLVGEGDLQRILRQEEITNIQIAPFLEDGVPKEILTVDPVIQIFALVYNKQH